MTRRYVRRQRPDPEVVARLVSGEHHPGRATDADVHEVVRQLVKLGFSDGQMARRLDRTVRSVQRTRTGLGLAPALPPGSNQHSWRVQVPARAGGR